MKKREWILRFAPSPTGYLHVGGARTAIFNELLKYKYNGKLILRIEDTDLARSDKKLSENIMQALEWLGVEWDQGPFFQSERINLYKTKAYQLVEKGLAYRCFCTKEELEKEREKAHKESKSFRYSGRCSSLSQEEIDDLLNSGKSYVIRFKMPNKEFVFNDLIRGEVVFPKDSFDDFVLMRSDYTPTYHLSVVVDDIEMGVTHVIRGEDHISNTPKHIELFRAFGMEPPRFGHLPLILDVDRKRLSKRSGAVSVEEFRDRGVLPEALYNYLVLLGWSSGDDREFFSKEELKKEFSVERIHSSPAIFDVKKLEWMNAKYLSIISVDRAVEAVKPFLKFNLEEVDITYFKKVIELHKTRARNLIDLADVVKPYILTVDFNYDLSEAKKVLKKHDYVNYLQILLDRYSKIESFSVQAVEAELRALASELGVKAGVLIHPLRYAISARRVGPPLFDMVHLLGKKKTLYYLAKFISFAREKVFC